MKKLAVFALTLPGQLFMPSLFTIEDDQEMPFLVRFFYYYYLIKELAYLVFQVTFQVVFNK